MLAFVLACLLMVSLLAGCSSDDRDRTGTVGQEQGQLDRDVEDSEIDPRVEPPGPGPSD